MQLGRELAAERRLAEARDQFARPTSSRRATPQAAMRWAAFAAARKTSARAGRLQPRAEAGLSRAHRDLPGMGQPPRASKIRRGDRLVPEGRAGDWVRAQAEDRDPHRPPARARRGPRIPAEDRAALLRGQHPDGPGRGAAPAATPRPGRKRYEMLSKAVASIPIPSRSSTTARWRRAIDKLDVLEADLRRVIRMKPDYCALRTTRSLTLAERPTAWSRRRT